MKLATALLLLAAAALPAQGRRGVKLETVRNVDVAPTIAALLGIRMEGVQGRPLAAVLE